LDAYGWADSPRLNWSLLRGVAHSLESAVFVALWGVATAAVCLGMAGRLTVAPEREPVAGGRFSFLETALLVWTVTAVLITLGFWARALPADNHTLVWLGPLLLWMLATVFVMIEFGVRLRGFARASDGRIAWLIGG